MSLAKLPVVFLPAAVCHTARLPVITQDFWNEGGDVSVHVLSPFLICEHTESWIKMTHQVTGPSQHLQHHQTLTGHGARTLEIAHADFRRRCLWNVNQQVCLMPCRKREFCWSSVAAIMCHPIKAVAHLHGFSCIARQRHSHVISFRGGAQR